MKQQRTLIVMVVAVATAGLAAFGMYQVIQRMPLRKAEMNTVPVVVATRALPVGTRLTTDDLKVVAWPAGTQLAGAFSKILLNSAPGAAQSLAIQARHGEEFRDWVRQLLVT